MENTELFKDVEEKVLKAKHECIKLGLEQFGIFEENYEEYKDRITFYVHNLYDITMVYIDDVYRFTVESYDTFDNFTVKHIGYKLHY